MSKIKKGFTLIELLVVIAIIAVLAGLVLVRVGSAAADARDSRRRNDLNQIKKAIEMAKISGTKVKPCPVLHPWPCDRPITLDSATYVDGGNDNLFVLSGSSKYPNEYISGNNYPADPKSNIPYWIRVKDATANADPSNNYSLIANFDKVVAEEIDYSY